MNGEFLANGERRRNALTGAGVTRQVTREVYCSFRMWGRGGANGRGKFGVAHWPNERRCISVVAVPVLFLGPESHTARSRPPPPSCSSGVAPGGGGGH